MRRLLAACAAMLVATALMGAGVSAAPGQTPLILRVKQPSAGGEASFGDCADPIQPPIGSVCHETYVLIYRETRVLNGGSNAPSQAPWAIYLESYTMTFWSQTEDPLISDSVWGFVEGKPVVAASDDQRVSSLTASATVPMSDGRTFSFQGTWSGYGDRWVYGNNGPVNESEGIPRHYVDKCATVNANAHQTGRDATMTGMLNGRPVRTYAFPSGAIFYNHFVYINVTHGGCN